jgi:hypothetical protein
MDSLRMPPRVPRNSRPSGGAVITEVAAQHSTRRVGWGDADGAVGPVFEAARLIHGAGGYQNFISASTMYSMAP